jgi:hypothetical protein
MKYLLFSMLAQVFPQILANLPNAMCGHLRQFYMSC